MKISVIGAGNVGGLTAMRLAQEDLGDVSLIDIAPGLAQGKAFDMEDAAPLVGSPYSVKGSQDIGAVEGSGIVVMTAGLARKPGMTREDLLAKNAAILRSVCDTVKNRAPSAIVIIVTNPLDVMTWYAVRQLGFGASRVFGMGVTLDAARFAALIAGSLNVPVTSVDACVIASHGEGMLPMPRFTTIKGVPLTKALKDPAAIESLCRKTVERGKEIVSLLGSGSASFAPSAAICQIVKAIARDEKKKLAASVMLDGQYGVSGVCLGTPCVIGAKGIESVVELPLEPGELDAFRSSAASVKRMCELLNQ